MACEDDHYVVVAGTFEKLVEQLACEEKPGTRNTYTHVHVHAYVHTHIYTRMHVHVLYIVHVYISMSLLVCVQILAL